MLITAVFLICAALAALASLAAMLLSPKPQCLVDHVTSLARLGVFTGCLFSAARVLMDGADATWERAVLMASLATLYLIQSQAEVRRQRRQGVTA